MFVICFHYQRFSCDKWLKVFVGNCFDSELRDVMAAAANDTSADGCANAFLWNETYRWIPNPTDRYTRKYSFTLISSDVELQRINRTNVGKNIALSLKRE